MDNKVPTPDFSSEDPCVEYFKYSPVSEWDFESFRKHMTEENRRKPSLASVLAKYRHCLKILAHFDDLSTDKMLIVKDLIENCEILQQEQPQKEPTTQTNYYNYGTVGFQGEMSGRTIFAIPSKRMLEETGEGHDESSKPPKSCQSGNESSRSLSSEEPEPRSFLTDTTDESFEAPESSFNHGKLLKQQNHRLIKWIMTQVWMKDYFYRQSIITMIAL
ncbi:hypothetical protein CLU79DRAFT_839996 [Phycomyces nitens]|nr:hypothetical protein CLU79DRAFT_839996 [Phycomyces nitens]